MDKNCSFHISKPQGRLSDNLFSDIITLLPKLKWSNLTVFDFAGFQKCSVTLPLSKQNSIVCSGQHDLLPHIFNPCQPKRQTKIHLNYLKKIKTCFCCISGGFPPKKWKSISYKCKQELFTCYKTQLCETHFAIKIFSIIIINECTAYIKASLMAFLSASKIE